MFNILISSVGTRGYLIDHFKESLGDKYGIYACDASKFAPALQKADKAFIIPYAYEDNYKDVLLDICLNNNIKIIFSINDLELNYLSKIKKEFKDYDIEIVISDEEIIDIAFDKYFSYEFCLQNNLPVPLTFKYNELDNIEKALNGGKLSFPLIAKPRRGSRSVGIQLIKTYEHLKYFLEIIKDDGLPEEQKHIIQEYVESDKYSLHIFNNSKETEIVIGMVNVFRNLGESFQIKTIKNLELLKLGKSIGLKLKHYGPLSVDVQRRKDGSFVILEFNPRVSGGYSLSHFAGADYPKRMVNLYKDKTFLMKNDYLENVFMLKQFETKGYLESEIDGKIINFKRSKK